MLRRRAVLLGGAGVLGAGLAGAAVSVERGVLPGRPFLQDHLGLNGDPGVVPTDAPGAIERGTLRSTHRPGVAVRWAIARPPAAPARLPVVVALHGLHQDGHAVIGGRLHVERYLAAAVADGVAPFAVAAVDGGTTYWHPHDGEDAGAMVVDDLLPLLARHGLDTARLGLLGWSMGGYGALRLAARLGPQRVRAVVASSPAMWDDPAGASRSGFDDADDYERETVQGHQDELAGIRVRVDVGTGDPFYRTVEDYVAGFPDAARVVSTFEPGAHDPAYWRRMLPAQLAFLGRALAPA